MLEYIEPITALCTAAIIHFAWNHAYKSSYQRFTKKNWSKLKLALLAATRRPIVWATWASAIIISSKYLEPVTNISIVKALPSWPSLLFFLTLLAIANRWVSKFQEVYETGDRSTNISAISKVVSAVLIAIIIFKFLDVAGIDYSSALTLGGIGTLAIGFAGKDILSNMLSSVALHSEKHINIGDFIKTQDGIKGTITRIGWRATTIMTPWQTPLYVPNSHLNQQPLENVSRNSHRHIKMFWTFKANDISKIQSFCEESGVYLSKLACVDEEKSTFCLMQGVTERGIDVFINFNLKTHDWEMSLRQKHEVVFHLISIAESINAEFAIAETVAIEARQGDSMTNAFEAG